LTVSADDVWEEVRRFFAADQLRVGRELRCLTQAELARATAATGRRALSAAAVSQFELGDAVPTPETIAALATALNVEPEFLTTRAADDESHIPAFFRSLRATPSRDRKRARNVTQLVHRLVTVLESHVPFPKRDVPTLPCDPFREANARRAEAERAASAVRKEWGTSRGPVDHVIDTIERHGVVCARLRFREERIDAFSVNFSDHPVAVLAADKDKWDRSRFDAAHELGHIVMHDEAAGVPEAERQANEFAAAFLMPARDIGGILPARADWGRLMELKAEWGTSIASLLMRARTLGVMTETTYVGATKMMSARGWRRHEPVEREPELPSLLSNAMRRARKRGIQSQLLRREAAIPLDLFDEVCNLIGSEL
jgi:Zn-dependent peptidase ImmA (M78 family)/transcriptional regulator with XRE-family HTH domain